jgi:hypothetical protein
MNSPRSRVAAVLLFVLVGAAALAVSAGSSMSPAHTMPDGSRMDGASMQAPQQ